MNEVVHIQQEPGGILILCHSLSPAVQELTADIVLSLPGHMMNAPSLHRLVTNNDRNVHPAVLTYYEAGSVNNTYR